MEGGTSKSAIGGAAAGSFIPGLGTATGGLIGAISGIYFSSKENIQNTIESGDIKKLTEYCEQMEELVEITKTKEITNFVTIKKTRYITRYKSGWRYLYEKTLNL